MNFLDRAVSWFNPVAGLRRTRARAAQNELLAYEAVRTERRQGGWSFSATSGNAEMGPALATLRNAAEDLSQNNAYARKSVRRWCRRVVGYGITPQADTGSDDLNAKIDALWLQWGKQCCSDRRLNIYAVQRMIVRTAFVRGECLVRFWNRRIEDNLAVPFQLQVMEPDYLDTGKTQETETGYIIHGVEFDKIGRIIGYWLYPQHPGEVVRTNTRSLVSKMIPAETILHHAVLERPGDVRSISQFAASINKLRDIDELADALIVRKRTEACLTAMVTQPEGAEGPTLGAIATDANGRRVESFEPGMVIYGAPGAGIQFFSPSSTGDYAQHKKTELREAFAGLDQPYTVIGNDLSDVNYSSFRGGAIDERDCIDEYRELWLIPQVLDPIWKQFIDTLVIQGVIPEKLYGVKWNPPPFDLLDREAEAKADLLELQIGKIAWPQLVGNQGLDPEKHIRSIAAWRQRLEEAGVRFAEGKEENGKTETPAA